MATETSVESEYFSNPTQEQIDALNEAISENSSNESSGPSSTETSVEQQYFSNPTKEQTEALNKSIDEDRTISYVNADDKEVKFTPREWEEEWDKNKVDNQWQNLGRSKEDMYDRYSGLDIHGKVASQEMSSIGVPKTSYLQGLYEKNEEGKYKYEDKLNAVKEARSNDRSILQKAVDGAKSVYNNTIGKVIDKVSAYRDDISEKARTTSDARKQSAIDDAKLLAKSNLQTSSPERKVTLERDATMLPPIDSTQKSDVLMKVQGMDKPATQKQVDEEKTKLTNEINSVKSSYVKNPSKTLSTFYAKTEMAKETGLPGLSYYDKNNTITNNNGKVIPTGNVTTKSGYGVDIEINPKGDFSKENLKSMFGVGPGREIGTATIHLEDGSTRTFTLHEDPKVSNNITVADENGKQVGSQITPNTPLTFIDGVSSVFDKIPGQALNESSPTVQEALKVYDEYIAETEERITNLENAKPDEASLASEWEKAVANTNPTAIVTEKAGGNRELINTSSALEKSLNQFTNPEDKEVATNWYNSYTPKIEEAMKKAEEDPVGNAGELAKVLDEARAALAPYAHENFTNFNTAVNDYVGAVAGTYFINTQLYDRGITADNAKEGIIDRLVTAYKSDEMSFGQKVLYTIGFGSKESETDKGVMQLRNFAEQSLGRTSELSDNFKGAVMSSLMAQSIDNKSTVGRAVKDALTAGGITALNAMSGFNPVVVGVTSLYVAHKSGERFLQEATEYERNKDNQERLASIRAGNDQKAMPSTVKEGIYNAATRGTGQDIKHVSEGVTNLVFGIATGEVALVADGVYELMKINSLNKEVKEFVGEENLAQLERIEQNTTEQDNETSDEKKRRKTDELEEVVKEGNKQEDIGGLNLPPLSDEDMAWLIKQPYMKNYKYE